MRRIAPLALLLLTALVACTANDEATQPTRSPDQAQEEKLVYEGGLGIFVANPDGTGARQLTEGDRTDTSPAWSADGRRIVFVRGRPPGEVDLPPAVDPWTTVVDWYGPADLSPEPNRCWLVRLWR